MFGERVRRLRTAAGLTQASLAARAGVSRQLVGAVEAGRHLPRVDAAAALARVLEVRVETLLAGSDAEPAVGVVDGRPPVGSPVALGRVGDRLVCAPVPVGGDGWAAAGGVPTDAGMQLLPGAAPGAVVVGCDPSIALAGRLASDRGRTAVLPVVASSAAAVAALRDGRTHVAVVHGPSDALPALPGSDVAARRWHLASWRVGLAAPADPSGGWWREALAGRRPIVQREDGAGSQSALRRAVAVAGGSLRPGVCAGGHAEAARHAQLTGMVALTIEPVALAEGMAFHPLEEHTAQWWVAADHADHEGVARFGEVLRSAAFGRRLEAVGGYDLARCGDAVAA